MLKQIIIKDGGVVFSKINKENVKKCLEDTLKGFTWQIFMKIDVINA